MPQSVSRSRGPAASKADLKPGIYLGAAAVSLLLLVPYLRQLFVPAYLLGPLAGVWFEIRRRRVALDFTQGAIIGFYSAFYGSVAALAFHQLAVRLFADKLWRPENLYLVLPLLAGKGLDSDTPIGWYVLMIELTVMAIFAAIFGAPSGLLGVKLFRSTERL
jgi:hypothetical protein